VEDNRVKKKVPLIFISILILFSASFTPAETIFNDDFDDYFLESNFKRDVQVWENGAVLNLFLEKSFVNSGENALGVQIVSPNPANNSIIGSVYRPLQLFEDNWSGGTGLRFWIKNPNENSLLLSFNLKERYREYWAVANEGAYYFADQDGLITQRSIQYGNLVIPADYEGFAIIPFASLSVPEWNTAKSNHVLNLNQVESYAFSMTVGEITPFTFYIDDVDILRQEKFSTLSLNGAAYIQIPQSGDHIESYTAQFGPLGGQSLEDVEAVWSIQGSHDSKVSITDHGVLTVPADVEGDQVSLVAQYELSGSNLVNTMNIVLAGNGGAMDSAISSDEASTMAENYSYHRSSQFDTWAAENRAIFIVLLILGVMVFLLILSAVERKLRV